MLAPLVDEKKMPAIQKLFHQQTVVLHMGSFIQRCKMGNDKTKKKSVFFMTYH